jgi:hypothetical protein
VGIAVKYILIGSLVLLFTLAGIWYWSMVNNVDQAKTIVEASGAMGKLTNRVKKDRDGFYVIDFSEAKGDSILPFTEYQKLDARTVRVYVSKEAR